MLIGVDNNGNVKGLDGSQVTRYLQKIQDLIREWIEPAVQVKVEAIEVRGKQVIQVRVPRESAIYNYKNHGVYIRAGSIDCIATRDELLLLFSSLESHRLKYEK